MKKIGKYSVALTVVVLLTLLLIAAFAYAPTAQDTANAEDDVLISDLTATDITYGEESKTFFAVVGTVNYETFDYAWYRSDTMSGLPLKVAESKSTDGKLYLTMTKPSESGYYRAEVTTVYEGGFGRTVSAVSNTVRMRFLPKPAEVAVSYRELVYDGTWQRPLLLVKNEDIVPGDTVNAYTDTGIATVNAGTYNAEIRLDNELYTVSGEREIAFTIGKAPLEIKIKDLAVRANTQYAFEIEYKGLLGGDKPDDLGFTPTISSSYYGYQSPGNYDVYCSGASETQNYKVSYPKGNLYIAKATLSAEEIKGNTATASGMFRIGTVLTLEEEKEKVQGLPFLGIVKYNYRMIFTSGASEGETYAITFSDKSISPFMLAVCYTDADGKIHAVDRFSYKDGELTISLPSEGVATLVIYNDYTVLLIVGAVLIVILLIVALAIAKSKEKYRRQRYFYEQAKDLADDYRLYKDENGNPKEDDGLF